MSVGTELAREEGKTLSEAIGEVRRASSILRYYAGRTSDPIGEVYASSQPGTRIHTIRQPLGVVAVITPWNFPIAIPAWKVAPALAFGNTVVFKPSGATPLSAVRLVEALVEAGLPPGVVNLVHATGAQVAEVWLRPDGADALTFTGSSAVGRTLELVAGSAGLKVQLELGGKNAVIVMPDAELDRTADLIVRGAMASAGQKCTSTARVIVVGQSPTGLRSALVERIEALVVGDPLDSATTLGPLIDTAARDRVGALVDAATAEGARIVTRRGVSAPGAFAPPILLDAVTPVMAISREEVFGPVVCLLEARNLADAITIHNNVAYGLSGAIFTRSLAAVDDFIHGARVGLVHVNDETAGAEPHVPFGGMKASSSFSREQGLAAESFFTQTKTVYVAGLPGAGLFDFE